MKRLFATILVACLLASLAACTEKTEPEPEVVLPVIALIAGNGGVEGCQGDATAYAGMERAQDDYEFELTLAEPITGQEYIDAMGKAAADGAKLVVGTAYLSKSKMKEIAQTYPDTSFALLDYDEEIADNVMSLAYQEQEGAFLVGVVAAMTTQTQIIGFVGGEDTDLMERYEYGFRAGVKTINANAQVVTAYAGTFTDPVAGETAAKDLITKGADVLFHAAGQTGEGVIRAAQAAGIRAIGADTDQSELAPETVVCSMFKRLDDGAYLAVQAVMEDEFEGGIMELGIDYEAVGYSDKAENLSDEVKEQVRAYIKAINADELYVPADRADFEEFTVPEGGFLTQP